MRYRVEASRIRLTGSVLGRVHVDVLDGVAILVVEGEPLATFPTLEELMSAFGLDRSDLEPVGE